MTRKEKKRSREDTVETDINYQLLTKIPEHSSTLLHIIRTSSEYLVMTWVQQLRILTNWIS
jgi:hypothetical protein